MKILLFYFLLLKGTATTFSGLASLPVLREDLVIRHHLLTDEQLKMAVVVTRTTPGPVGLYVVSVGYFVGGWTGAFVGWLAMITPALLILPLIHYVGKRAEHPRLKGMIRGVVLASAGLLWAATIPLASEVVRDPWSISLTILCIAVLLTRKVDSLWVILAAAVLNLAVTSLHLVSGLG